MTPPADRPGNVRSNLFVWAILVAAASLAAGPAPGPAPRLRHVVAEGNAAWIRAGRSLDRSGLEPFFAGEALTYLGQILSRARDEGLYMDLELLAVSYEKTEVDAGGGKGSVAVSETWRVTWRHVGTKACEVIVKPRVRWQTYRLQKSARGWLIVGIDEQPNPSKPETEECPSGTSG